MMMCFCQAIGSIIVAKKGCNDAAPHGRIHEVICYNSCHWHKIRAKAARLRRQGIVSDSKPMSATYQLKATSKLILRIIGRL